MLGGKNQTVPLSINVLDLFQNWNYTQKSVQVVLTSFQLSITGIMFLPLADCGATALIFPPSKWSYIGFYHRKKKNNQITLGQFTAKLTQGVSDWPYQTYRDISILLGYWKECIR